MIEINLIKIIRVKFNIIVVHLAKIFGGSLFIWGRNTAEIKSEKQHKRPNQSEIVWLFLSLAFYHGHYTVHTQKKFPFVIFIVQACHKSERIKLMDKYMEDLAMGCSDIHVPFNNNKTSHNKQQQLHLNLSITFIIYFNYSNLSL